MKKIYAVILASGRSTRLGFNKLTLKIDGKSVISMAVEPFIREGVHRVFIVTNPDDGGVKGEVEGLIGRFPGIITHVSNPGYKEGMSSSVKASIPYIADADGVFFQLGDKPFIGGELVERMLQVFSPESDDLPPASPGGRKRAPVYFIVPVFEGRKGHPVLVDSKRCAPEMASLAGDRGLREIIEKYRDNVLFIDGNEGNVLDIDTPQQVELLKERGYIIEKD